MVFSIGADIVFTAIRTRTRSKIIQTEEFYNTQIKPIYSPIEFETKQIKDIQIRTEQHNQIADSIVASIMAEINKMNNL